MKALLCKKFGPVSDLSWEETADPVAGPKDVVIDIKAAGLNYPDNLIVQGLYQFKPDLPFSPGHEGAGTVSSVGKDVSSLRVGDNVVFFKGFGAFAEKVAVHEAFAFSYSKIFFSPCSCWGFLWYMEQVCMPYYKEQILAKKMRFWCWVLPVALV